MDSDVSIYDCFVVCPLPFVRWVFLTILGKCCKGAERYSI